MIIEGIEINDSMSIKDIELKLFGHHGERYRLKVYDILIKNGEDPEKYKKWKRKEKRYCECCGKELKTYQYKYCSRSCSVSANNLKRGNKVQICKNCGKEFKTYKRKGSFCSKKCFADYKSKQIYKKIINGDETIMTSSYSPTRVAYKYIMQEQDNKCSICGMKNIWQEKPIKFIVDHIDGDASNNKRDNLRCICPNCDSQLDTYKNTKNHRSTRIKRK